MADFALGPAGLFAVGLAVVHLFGERVSLSSIPRSDWLSMAGGVSVAYVFVHILPELEGGRTVLQGLGGVFAGFLEHHVYLVALVGFSLYYGVERLAQRSSHADGDEIGGAEADTTMGVFWVHMGSFAAYNALVGYLLVHRETPGTTSLLLFATAMALHFVVNDHGLRDHHHDAYRHVGRWILAAAVVVGWAVGALTELREPVVDTLFAFLAGGVVLNVIKEELPTERQSRFLAFAAGATGYTVLLLAV